MALTDSKIAIAGTTHDFARIIHNATIHPNVDPTRDNPSTKPSDLDISFSTLVPAKSLTAAMIANSAIEENDPPIANVNGKRIDLDNI